MPRSVPPPPNQPHRNPRPTLPRLLPLPEHPPHPEGTQRWALDLRHLSDTPANVHLRLVGGP